MRHAYFGKKLSRTTDVRKQLLRNLARDLFLHGHITTTKAKAYAVRPIVEQIITKAKAGTEQKRREALAMLPDKKVIAQIWEDAKTRFSKRTSGFTTMIAVGTRRGDAGTKMLFRLIDERVIAEVVESSGKGKVASDKPEKPVVKAKKKATTK